MWWNKYINIKFAEKGRDSTGCDCWGLARLIYKNELNIELPDYLDVYNSTNDTEKLAKVIKEEKEHNWQQPDTGKEFDIIILNMKGRPMHIGVVIKPNYMVHCSKGVNTAIERFDSIKWKNRVIGFARYAEK